MNKTGSLLKGIACTVIGGALVLGAAYLVFYTALLAYGGKTALAYVQTYDPSGCGRAKRRHICHYHNLSADGRTFRIDLGRQFAVGDTIFITYLPNDPSVVEPGAVGSSPWEYVTKNVGWVEGVMFAIGALWIWSGMSWFRDLRSGARVQP
jgi:hypothetical protein